MMIPPKFSLPKIFFFVILLLNSLYFAQQTNYKFERYTINNGLSNNSVNCVLQTADGYLWIATKDGLNRFDGQIFKIFKKDALQKNSLPENYIMSLYEDRKNTLWVGTWGFGLCKYDPTKEEFIRVDKTAINDFVQCMEEDEQGNIWFGTTLNGLKKYDVNSHIITAFNSTSTDKNFIPANNVTSILFQNSETLWIATWGAGLIKYSKANGSYRQLMSSDEKNSLANNSIWHIVKAGNDRIYVSTDSGLDLLDTKRNEFTHHPHIISEHLRTVTTAIRQVLRDKDNRFWIGSYNYQGMFVLTQNNFKEFAFNRLLNQDDDPYSLICQRIRWIYEDKYLNIWIGTEDGLNKLPKAKKFEQYKYMPNRPNSLGGRVVSSVYEGSGNNLWVGFGGQGFDKIDLTTNKIKHFKSIAGNTNSLNVNDVISLIEDNNGIIWIGTSNGGLNRFDPNKDSFKHYTLNPNSAFSIKSNWVQQVLETRNGNLLIGTNDGLQIFDRASEKFKTFSPLLSDTSVKIPNVISVNSLYEDKQNNIWIGTWLDGLFRYDPTVKKVFHYSPSDQNNSISGNKISSIVQDQKGYMWIGTFGNGLNKLDKRTGKVVYYNTANGLPNDCVFGILEDNKGFIWISTMKGLAKLNPENGKLRVYDVEDGLVNNQFNWHAYHKSKTGKLYFGGIAGFVSFFPDSIQKEISTPNVVLTSFKVFDKEAQLPRSLPTTKEISLEHDQNFFSIDFTALDLLPTHKHQFAFMLEGIDPQWVYTDTRTTAFYTDIKHGNYHFLVKATNPDGTWGTPTSLSIYIHPAWWNTIWFRIISIGFIAGIIFAGYKYRVNQLLEIEKIRFSIASDLHDEIGSNLSSISVDSQSLMTSPSLSETERELSVDISKTAKATVDAMRDIIWFINPKNDVNEDIIFKMKQTAAKLLTKFEWDFEASADARLDTFNLDVRRNIFLLYKEALTNVINHSNAKKCNINISGSPKNFSLKIQDDGIGFDMKDFKSSTGIRSMEARAKKINARLIINSIPNKGTTLELIV